MGSEGEDLPGAPNETGGSEGKESACSVGDSGSIPGSGRSAGEGNGYPLQCSCLKNPISREAWRATVHGQIVRHGKKNCQT